MRQDIHKEAAHLLMKAAIEPLSAAEAEWLTQHVSSCRTCAVEARRLEEVIRSLRLASVAANPALVEATRRRIRERARSLAPTRLAPGLAWLGCLLTWLWVGLSAPFIWRGFAWAGRAIGAPDWAWEMGFGLWWLVPALAAAAAVGIHISTRDATDEGYAES